MGYQIIDAIKPGKNYSDRFVIYNSELIVDLDDKFLLFKNRILDEGYNKIFSRVDFLSLSSVGFVSKGSIIQKRLMDENKRSYKRRHSGGSGAIESAIQNADGNESYVRLSIILPKIQTTV